MTTEVPEPLCCPVHLIHPDTAAYLDGRQSVQKNLCVAWPIEQSAAMGLGLKWYSEHLEPKPFPTNMGNIYES